MIMEADILCVLESKIPCDNSEVYLIWKKSQNYLLF